jgi:hypothetical protein
LDKRLANQRVAVKELPNQELLVPAKVLLAAYKVGKVEANLLIKDIVLNLLGVKTKVLPCGKQERGV